MEVDKLLREVLKDWDDLGDQLELVCGLLIKRLAERRNLPTDAALTLIRQNLLLAGIRLGAPKESQIRNEFEKALETSKMESEIVREDHVVRKPKAKPTRRKPSAA
jgi:hypothetical protein